MISAGNIKPFALPAALAVAMVAAAAPAGVLAQNVPTAAAAAQDPATKQRVQNAVGEIAERLGIGRDQKQLVMDKIDQFAREFSYIEALRERCAAIKRINETMVRLMKIYRADKSVTEDIVRILQLLREPSAEFDTTFAFIDAQTAMADMPSSHLNLGVLYASQGKRELAVAEYLTALRMDPYFAPARANLVALYNSMGRNAEALEVLREGIKRTPNEGELHYSLGLLLAEEKRLGEAADALGAAARLMPQRARVRYNLGLALDRLSRDREAEAALLQAFQLDPRDPDIVYATAAFYFQRQQWKRAQLIAEQLVAISPGDPRPRQLLEAIRQGLASGPPRR